MNHQTRPGGMFEGVDGPQLKTDWLVTVGLQKSFEPLGHH